MNILISAPASGEENYTRAFSFFGFVCSSFYCPDDFGYDGLVLSGGGDIDPSYFGERNTCSNSPDTARDKAELLLFEKYREQKKPIFGICRGMQIMNVFLGGTLKQHLQSFKFHFKESDIDNKHIVHNSGIMFDMFGSDMIVNSAHHQGCSTIGKGLSVVQRCPYDDVAEAVIGESMIGVQWHPERMLFDFKLPGYRDVSPLFLHYFNMFEKKYM